MRRWCPTSRCRRGELQPKVPRDLETICLKCLTRNPAALPSAGDLADDLRRFLEAGRHSRAADWSLERGWKWVRRHTALAALLAISVLTVVGFPAGYLVYSARLSWALHQYEKDRAETNRRQIVRLEIREGNHALEEGDWYTALLWFTEALALDEGDPAQEQMHRIRIGTLRQPAALVAAVLVSQWSGEPRRIQPRWPANPSRRAKTKPPRCGMSAPVRLSVPLWCIRARCWMRPSVRTEIAWSRPARMAWPRSGPWARGSRALHLCITGAWSMACRSVPMAGVS